VSTGTLFVIPVPLGDIGAPSVLAGTALATIRTLERFIAEDAKSARAFLKSVGMQRPLADIQIRTLDKHSDAVAWPELLAPALSGERVGLLSEAGYPAVADPGAELIAAAHASGVRVVPLVGPSSLLLALAASGLNGQRFCFHGYLPIPEQERSRAIGELELRSRQEHATQIFIETPYRNQHLLESLVRTCAADTLLCIATELTLPEEAVRTLPIARWKSELPDINRRPTVFLLQAQVSNAAIPRKPSASTPRRLRSRNAARSVPRDSPSE
jgi:16S rRNA (cytidine1402-2'-O)-methyltransferase